MEIVRRDFLAGAALSLCLPAASAEARLVPSGGKLAAIAFDAFVIFDFRTIVRTAQEILADRGASFAANWLQKLFSDTWLLTSAGRYQPFEAVAANSLAAVAERMEPTLSARNRDLLLESFSRLDVWPDARPALARLRSASVRTCLLSNLSEELLKANMERSGLGALFDLSLSTDRVRQFKPAPAAYAMAPQAFGLPATAIGFAAFGEWDAIGATWFGYRTAWVNRSGARREWPDVAPEITTAGVDGVLELAGVQGPDAGR